MPMRILIVDDDAELVGLLTRDLRGVGYAVDTVGSAEDALVAVRGTRYGLVVVDLGLPDRDGLTLIREMRAWRLGTPVLVLTARRSVEDRVIGLTAGADDYVIKPFALPELRARVAVLLRRRSLDVTSLAVGNVMLDHESCEAVVEGRALDLARKEFALLELLVRRSGLTTPKRMIEETLYGFDDEVSSNSVEVLVYKVRKALRGAGARASIETRRGIGYRLVGQS
jgi:DNA-binding response OmpR family regulator